MWKEILIVVLAVALVASILVSTWLRLRAAGVSSSKLISSYKLEINAGGKLECDLTLVDGRVLSFTLDPAIVYDLSNALLSAATRMGARRQGIVEVEPDALKPTHPAVQARK